MKEYTLSADENGRFPWAFKNKAGGPATVEAGSQEISSSDETVAKFSDDGKGNIFCETFGPGEATGTIKGDANLAPGPENVQTVSTLFKLTVTPLNADHADLGDMVPEAKPTP